MSQPAGAVIHNGVEYTGTVDKQVPQWDPDHGAMNVPPNLGSVTTGGPQYRMRWVGEPGGWRYASIVIHNSLWVTQNPQDVVALVPPMKIDIQAIGTAPGANPDYIVPNWAFSSVPQTTLYQFTNYSLKGRLRTGDCQGDPHPPVAISEDTSTFTTGRLPGGGGGGG